MKGHIMGLESNFQGWVVPDLLLPFIRMNDLQLDDRLPHELN
jgi:hypothetical protein